MKRQVILLLGVFAVTMLVLGCKGRVPFGYSFDRHEFLSTYDRPMTIVLERRSDGQELWRKDIPVGQRLVMEFGRESDDTREGVTMGLESHMPADWVTWELVDDPNSWMDNELANRVELDGEPIRMRMVIRQTKETMTAANVMPAVQGDPVETIQPVETIETTPVPEESVEEEALEELDDAMEESVE